MAYTIEFSESVKDHLKALTTNQRTIILDAIETQLKDEPLKETRHRKPLRPNPIAPWELRVGELRVFYENAPEPSKTIMILAIGHKQGNQLFIGGTEVSL